jgi:peptide deformylase
MAIGLGCAVSTGAFTIINPVITWRSSERIKLWDDCMSFPWIMVRVLRHRHISMTFQDDAGHEHHWKVNGRGLLIKDTATLYLII